MLATMFQVYWPFGSGEEAIETILAIIDVQVTRMLPTEFQVNWPFGSGEETKNRFTRWPPRRLSWISDRNDLTTFYLQSPRRFLPSF